MQHVMHVDDPEKRGRELSAPFRCFGMIYTDKDFDTVASWYNIRNSQSKVIIEVAQVLTVKKALKNEWIGMRFDVDAYSKEGHVWFEPSSEMLTTRFDLSETKTMSNAVRREISMNAMSSLLMLCYDVMSPANTVLRVSPGKQGKSVEWTLSHTHYLILNRKQAESIRSRKSEVTEHDIKRAAHWRRAHLRRLSSDKFKHKKGSLIMVRQAWVGPDEWAGTDGKIYKVVQHNINN